MTSAPGAVAGRRALPAPLGWVWCLVLGLALGWFCRWPLIYTWLTGRAVAWQFGWVSIDPTLVDDGLVPFFLMSGVLWMGFALVAVPVTALARRGTRLSARSWWWGTVIAWTLPFVVLDLPGLPG